ncbi:capsular polysaccharide synthesis protein [Rhodoplanes roseus]|uniref:capsular polysaccharide synthesis protein n=1 Tax=Rhodoplanes roseus TaxID=29409 RepID=UPI001FDFEC3F|nr:capsular polysaccharide synthesis protein [Rhodoplanes roseus]
MVPHVVRFVFGLRPQTAPFHLLHYLCLASCLEVVRPERVVVHCLNQPWGPLWDLIRPRIEVEPIRPEDMDQGFAYDDPFMARFSYAHVCDILRLKLLLAHGGVYADMDTLFVRPLPAALFEAPCVMGHERPDPANPKAADGSLCNAFIMAEPGAEFIRLWLEQIRAAFDGSWSNHACTLPYRLSRSHPQLIRVEPARSFFALDWTPDGIAALFERSVTLPHDAYSLHLWAHLWWDRDRRDMSRFSHEQITPAYVAHADTTYAHLARRFLPPGRVPSPLRHRLERAYWSIATARMGVSKRRREPALRAIR